jgi:hypothetical protein
MYKFQTYGKNEKKVVCRRAGGYNYNGYGGENRKEGRLCSWNNYNIW